MNNRKEELFMFDRLDDILIRFEELLHELGDPVLTSDPEKFRRLMKEQAELAPLVETYTQYKKTKKSNLHKIAQHFL
jgi:peptide chain release factor 1